MSENPLRRDFVLKFSKIETLKKSILNSVEEYSNNQLNYKPANDKWSLAQVISHLITSEQRSLAYIKKKILAGTENPDSGLYQKMKLILLKFALKLPVKYKAPYVVASVPDSASYENLVNDWNQVRNEMKDVLDGLPNEFFNKQLFKHPSIGKISILHFLEFLESHITHHILQINNLKEVLKSKN